MTGGGPSLAFLHHSDLSVTHEEITRTVNICICSMSKCQFIHFLGQLFSGTFSHCVFVFLTFLVAMRPRTKISIISSILLYFTSTNINFYIFFDILLLV